jgi:hypothetical protein
MKRYSLLLALLFSGFSFVACGGDDEGDDTDGDQADLLGIGAQCDATEDCPIVEFDSGAGGGGGVGGGSSDGTTQLQCLTQFAGGYCAIENCSSNADCPEDSTCVAHTDGTNYCFRECAEKSECNANRDAENEANCSANFDYAHPADETSSLKACVPPSSGD